MNKVYVCIFSMIAAVFSCCGMDKHPNTAGSPGMDYCRVIADSQRGSYCDGIDEDLLRRIYKSALRSKRRFSSLSRGEMPELNESESSRQQQEISASYEATKSFLDTYFPNGSNEQELSKYYGHSYKFEYGDGPLGSLKMTISLPEHKDYVCALLDKNGWIVLFQYSMHEWLHSHLYDYKHNTYSFRGIKTSDAIVRVTEI